MSEKERVSEKERDRGMLRGSPALQGPSFVRNEAPSQRSSPSSRMRRRRLPRKRSIGSSLRDLRTVTSPLFIVPSAVNRSVLVESCDCGVGARRLGGGW